MRKIWIIIVFCSIALGSFAQDTLSTERKQAIDTMALEKVRDLSKYITVIGNKSTLWAEADRVINRACELFMDGSQIGVSLLYKTDIEYFAVRKYFEKLMRLNYDKVDVEWFKINYVSDLVQQPDGTYVGVITVYQKFSAYNKENLMYQDITKKDITIYVKKKQTQIGGRLIGFWDVLLGDIRVKETKKG